MSEPTAVVRRDSAPLTVAGFALSRTGIIPPEGDTTTYEDWQLLGEWLSYCERAVHWWLGDWFNYGEQQWGDKYTQAIEATGFCYQTLADDRWVAGRIDFSRRREKLPFSHHKEVASLEPADQDHFLDKAESEGWSKQDLRQHVATFKAPRRDYGDSFNLFTERDAIEKWLHERRNTWPEHMREGFIQTLRNILESLEGVDCDEGGCGEGGAPESRHTDSGMHRQALPPTG